ncbi:MAG TPA: TraR/DksA family transcriptional regulator [Candidatus Binataceae bacterium]|nr:TraR/DksA family transcriptional regulator [Candidatus Binataceae bacterium]
MIRKHPTATASLGDNFRRLPARTKAAPPADRAGKARAMLSWLREQEITKLKGLIHQEVSRETSAPGDESDRALLQEGIELQASLIGLSESRLAAIWAAFDRLAEDRYGICERCGDEMPFERLRAMPMALRCVDCQAKFEAARDLRAAGGGTFRDAETDGAPTDDRDPAPRLSRRLREAR